MIGTIDKLVRLTHCTRKMKIIKLVISLLAITTLLALLPAFIYKNISGVNFEATNFSNIITSEEIASVQFSPLSNNLKSIRLRVVTSPDFTTQHTEMLVRILDKDQVVLEHVFANDAITDGKFCTIDGTMLKPNREYTFEIKSNDPNSGFLLLTGVNGGAKEHRQWTWSVNLEADAVEIEYIYDEVNVKKLALALAFLLIGIAFFLVPFEIKSARLKLVYDLLVLAMASYLTFYFIELLAFNPLSSIALVYIVATVLFMFCLNLGVYLLFSYCFISVAITSTVFLLVGIVNHFVILYRHNVFVPSDLFAAATAANIISGYRFDISQEIVIAVAIFIFLLSISFNKRIADKSIKKTIIRVVCGIVLLTGTLFTIASSSFHKAIGASVNYYEPQVGASQYGFVLNFAVFSTELAYIEPSGYSAKALQAVMPLPVANARAAFAPNVIVVMNESLADFSDLGILPINKNYLPFIHSLANGENSFVGRIVVPVFGGGTSNTEFEALTGFSFACSPNTQAPYLQFIRGQTPSLAQAFNSHNYISSSLHLCEKKNWYRNTAYPNIGFNTSLFLEDFNASELHTYRETPSDDTHYEILLKEFEKTRADNVPFFNYSITIQNHGGYSGLFDYNEIEIDQDGFGTAAQYLNLAYLSDQAFESFIGEIEQINEPTLVVMFGDHYPTFTQDFYGLIKNGQPESNEQISNLYKTPIIFWANFDIDTKLIPDTFSINYLQTILLDLLDMPKTAFQQFLSDSMQELPVFSIKGFVDKDDNYYSALTGTPYEQLYTDYSYWQYAGLFHCKRLETLFYS